VHGSTGNRMLILPATSRHIFLSTTTKAERLSQRPTVQHKHSSNVSERQASLRKPSVFEVDSTIKVINKTLHD
jgi:hypothetical protein